MLVGVVDSKVARASRIQSDSVLTCHYLFDPIVEEFSNGESQFPHSEES
jgi:hypothetical protein